MVLIATPHGPTVIERVLGTLMGFQREEGDRKAPSYPILQDHLHRLFVIFEISQRLYHCFRMRIYQ